MPYSKIYLMSKAIATYQGRTEVEFQLPAEDLEAIELVMNLPDKVNEMFDETIANSEPVHI